MKPSDDPTPTWKRVKAWHDRLARTVLAGCETDCRRFFEVDRLRLEVLVEDGALLEVRIPCKQGELYPVGSGRWGWSGSGGYWARKVIAVLGMDATGPLGLPADAATLSDEAVVWFPARRVLDLAGIVGARRRRHAGDVANFAGAA